MHASERQGKEGRQVHTQQHPLTSPETLDGLLHPKNAHHLYHNLSRACGQISSLSVANRFHACIVVACLDGHVPLAHLLIGLYARLKSIKDACAVFQGIPQKTVVSWNAIMAACVGHGSNHEALSLFSELLQSRNTHPNNITFIRALGAASCQANLPLSMILHSHIVEYGSQLDLFVNNVLISTYDRCGCLDDAARVFQQMPTQDVVSWTALIDAYATCDDTQKALQLFECMQSKGVKPNAVTFVSLIKAFNKPASLVEGKEIHALIERSGMELDPMVGNALVGMYGKCGDLEAAHAMYKKIRSHGEISWNCILGAYAQQGHGKDVLALFGHGHKDGLKPNKVTFITALDACAGMQALQEGRLLHFLISEYNIVCDVVLETALLNMYGKCASVEDAKVIFDAMALPNVVSWTAIISAYSQHGHFREALEAFHDMMFSYVRPNNVTFIAVLDACTSRAVLVDGKLIHFVIVCGALELDSVVGHSLLTMYSNCGQIEDAVFLFDTLAMHDVIGWTSMISAFAQHGQCIDALQLFSRMLKSSTKPNSITFICVLDTCATLSTLVEGKLIHAYFVELELALDCDIGTALVNMYGKCGSVEDAHMIFDICSEKDLVTWNAMLSAYAQHGYGKQAIQLYRDMEEEGVHPNGFTFINVIHACSHAGLVGLGQEYFNTMKPKYGITATTEHYVCMVDLLARAGQLKEAEKYIQRMPVAPTATAWVSYLSACRLHGDLKHAAIAAANARKLEPENFSSCVVLSNIYAALGRWDDLAKIGEFQYGFGLKGEEPETKLGLRAALQTLTKRG